MKALKTDNVRHCEHCGADISNRPKCKRFCSKSCSTTWNNLYNRKYGPNPIAIEAMRTSHQLNPGRRGSIPAVNKQLRELLDWPTDWSEYSVSLKGVATPGGPVKKAVIDFAIPDMKIGIEIDGAKHRKKEVQSYDQARSESLNKLGWKILRFSDRRLLEDPDGFCSDILLHIQKELHARSTGRLGALRN